MKSIIIILAAILLFINFWAHTYQPNHPMVKRLTIAAIVTAALLLICMAIENS